MACSAQKPKSTQETEGPQPTRAKKITERTWAPSTAAAVHMRVFVTHTLEPKPGAFGVTSSSLAGFGNYCLLCPDNS